MCRGIFNDHFQYIYACDRHAMDACCKGDDAEWLEIASQARGKQQQRQQRDVITRGVWY